jgi:hypothetical protein
MERVVKPAIAIMCLMMALPVTALGDEAAPLFHIAILSDRVGGHVPGVYERVIDEINLLGPDLVVDVGDHIEGYGEDYDLARAEWDTLLPVLGRLKAPLRMTPGNHDIWSDGAEQVYVEKTGRQPYYSFDYMGVHFIILDTGRIESAKEVTGPQMDWLLADLEANKGASQTFVFFHKPFWEQTLPAGKPDPLHDIFVKYGVDAVFNGHYHVTIGERFDGIDYTVVGSSGAAMSHPDGSVVRGEFYQFGWVTVRPDGHDIAIVDLGGIYPRDVVTEKTLAEVARIESDQVSVTPVPYIENTSARAEVTVTIRNASAKAVDDMLVWDKPGGWVMEPAETHVAVAPGAVGAYSFQALNTGALYPAPSLSFEYPMSDGRGLDVSVPLRVVRTVSAARFAAPPAIDGRLDEPCWTRAGSVTQLFPPYEDTVEGETRLLFGYDAENLYIAASCSDPAMDRLAAALTERDGAVYGEDCVGFFLQPDRKDMTVYQIYWNALATAFDQKISFDESMTYTTDRAWDGEYEAAGAQSSDRWTLEVRIPLATFGVTAEPGSVWGLNFRRKQARTTASADWQVPIDYNPRSFGELVFE